jgi:hypothetical protein
MPRVKIDPQKAGESRLMKVLVRYESGEVAGHRGYPVALHEASRSAIVVAATEGFESGFTWGRLYLVQETDPSQHPWVVREVASVPRGDGWELFEALIDDRAGHMDTF